MKAQIEQTTMGYHVKLEASWSRFDSLLDLFKSSIPKKCRRFMGRYWFVDLRAGKKLARFAESISTAGGEVLKG